MWIFRVVLFDWGAGILVLVSPGGRLIPFQHDDRFATYEGSVTVLMLVTLREADGRHELQSVCHWSVESLQQRPLNGDNARLKGNKKPSDFSFVAVVEYLPQNVAKKKTRHRCRSISVAFNYHIDKSCRSIHEARAPSTL